MVNNYIRSSSQDSTWPYEHEFLKKMETVTKILLTNQWQVLNTNPLFYGSERLE